MKGGDVVDVHEAHCDVRAWAIRWASARCGAGSGTDAMAGVVAGTVGLATVCVAAAVLARGAATRSGAAAAVGLIISAVGVLGIAVCASPLWAAAAAVATGSGNGLFVPLLPGTGPPCRIARCTEVIGAGLSTETIGRFLKLPVENLGVFCQPERHRSL
jgi:hypothetical protein